MQRDDSAKHRRTVRVFGDDQPIRPGRLRGGCRILADRRDKKLCLAVCRYRAGQKTGGTGRENRRNHPPIAVKKLDGLAVQCLFLLGVNNQGIHTYSRFFKMLLNICSNFPASEIQQTALRCRIADQGKQIGGIPCSRKRGKTCRTGGGGGAVTHAEGLSGQVVAFGNNPPGGFGGGLGSQDKGLPRSGGQGRVQELRRHEGGFDDLHRRQGLTQRFGKAGALTGRSGQQDGRGAGLSGHAQRVTSAFGPRQRKAQIRTPWRTP